MNVYREVALTLISVCLAVSYNVSLQTTHTGIYNRNRKYSTSGSYVTYLWNTGNDAERPGEGQHDPPSFVSVVNAERFQDGEVSVKGDADENETGQVEAEGAKKHKYAASGLTGFPRYCALPNNLQGHHNEGHQKVSYAQVHDEEIDTRLPVAVPEEGNEYCQVPACSDQKQNGV